MMKGGHPAPRCMVDPDMTDALTEMLATRDWLLADGATGTNLFNMGLQSGDAPELWNADEPEKIRTLYRGAVEARVGPVPDQYIRRQCQPPEAA